MDGRCTDSKLVRLRRNSRLDLVWFYHFQARVHDMAMIYPPESRDVVNAGVEFL